MQVAEGPEPDDLVATDLFEHVTNRVSAGPDTGQHSPLIATDLDVLTGWVRSERHDRLERYVAANVAPLLDLGPYLVEHGQHRNGGLAAGGDHAHA